MASNHGRSERTEHSGVLEECVERTTAVLGGACVVRLFDSEAGGFVAGALDHVDEARRSALREASDRVVLHAPGGWVGQAIERGCTLRLADVDNEQLQELGLPPDGRVGEVMVVPIPARNGALVVTRDRIAGPFGSTHRRQVEHLASELNGGESAPSPSAAGASARHSPFGEDHFLEVSSAAVWVVDPSGATVYMNEAASELVGCPADELCGSPIDKFLGNTLPRARPGFYGDEAADRPLVRADGVMRWVSAMTRPLSEVDGEHELTVYTLVDVTERRAHEVELRMRVQRQAALLDLAEQAAAGAESDHLLTQAASTIAEQLEVELAAVGRVDGNRGVGHALAAVGWEEEALSPERADRAGESLPAGSAALHAVRTSEPVLVLDYESQSAYERGPLLERAGVRSAVVVPLANGTALLGAHSPRPNALHAEDIDLMEAIARLLEPRMRWASTG